MDEILLMALVFLGASGVTFLGYLVFARRHERVDQR